MKSNTAEIKNQLHKLISETEDEVILNKIRNYFNILKSDEDDWWDHISDDEKSHIREGIEQLERGKGIPYDEVKKKVNKLLGR